MANVAQRRAFNELWDRADVLEPGKHVFHFATSPAMESIRCSCGWSAAQSRRQNALARAAKLDRASREHALEIIARHAQQEIQERL